MSIAAIVTGLGHGSVSQGFGGGFGGYAIDAEPGYIRIQEQSRNLHIGDIASFLIDLFNYDNEAVDPTDIVIDVDPPGSAPFSLRYSDGYELADRIVRRGVGQYTLHIDLTPERGCGTYHFIVRASGLLQAVEPGQCAVEPLPFAA